MTRFFSLRSISGRTRFSIAGMWTFIIQSAQSMVSGAQGSRALSASSRRAKAARVLEQSKGPLMRAVNGSKSPWISAIFASPRAMPSSALAAGASAGPVFFTSDASSRVARAMAGDPVFWKRARVTKVGSKRDWSALTSGLPFPLRW